MAKYFKPLLMFFKFQFKEAGCVVSADSAVIVFNELANLLLFRISSAETLLIFSCLKIVSASSGELRVLIILVKSLTDVKLLYRTRPFIKGFESMVIFLAELIWSYIFPILLSD